MAKTSRSRERPLPKGNFPDDLKKRVVARYKQHITLESQRLYNFFTEMEEAGVSASEIERSLQANEGHPAYGISWLRKWCLRSSDEYTPDLGPSGNTVI